MSEPLFFQRPNGLTAQEIAALTGAVARPGVAPDRRISGIAALDRAGPGDLAFLQNPKYAGPFAHDARRHLPHHRAIRRSGAGAMSRSWSRRRPIAPSWRSPRSCFPGAMRPSSLFEASGISPSALVHPSARLENGVTIDPAAVIGPRAEIGAGTTIAAGAVIGPDVRIGRDCTIGAGATIVHALIGDRVIIHAGARIGQDGFGYLPGPKRARQGPAGRARHHPGRRRDRRQHDHRPRLHPRYRDRGGDQDRQPGSDRAQLRDRAPLRHGGLHRDFRLRDGRGLCHDGRPGRDRRQRDDRVGRDAGRRQRGSRQRSSQHEMGRLSRHSGARVAQGRCGAAPARAPRTRQPAKKRPEERTNDRNCPGRGRHLRRSWNCFRTAIRF